MASDQGDVPADAPPSAGAGGKGPEPATAAIAAWLRADRQRVPSWFATAASYGWRLLVIIAVVAVLLAILTRLAIVTVPVIVALILTTLAAPPVRWLERRMPSVLAALIVVVGGLVVVLGGLAALTPSFVAEMEQLGPTVDQGVQDALTWLEQGPLGIDGDQIDQWIQQATQALQEQGGELAASAASLLTTVVEVVTALVLSIVLLFFFAKDGPQIAGWMRARIPDPHRATASAVGFRAWESLAGYVRGTATVAAVDAVGIGIGLAIVGVPLVLPLSVLVFFGGFIPVVGATVSGLLAVLVAWADGGITPALIVTAIVIAVQQLESDVLQPVIMRRVVPLHPVVILTVLAAGATLVGLVGAFLAVPVAASISAASNELRLRHERDEHDEDRPLGGPSGLLSANES